jgi:hypothetical protein
VKLDRRIYDACRALSFRRGLRFCYRAGRVSLFAKVFHGTVEEATAFMHSGRYARAESASNNVAHVLGQKRGNDPAHSHVVGPRHAGFAAVNLEHAFVAHRPPKDSRPSGAISLVSAPILGATRAQPQLGAAA